MEASELVKWLLIFMLALLLMSIFFFPDGLFTKLFGAVDQQTENAPSLNTQTQTARSTQGRYTLPLVTALEQPHTGCLFTPEPIPEFLFKDYYLELWMNQGVSELNVYKKGSSEQDVKQNNPVQWQDTFKFGQKSWCVVEGFTTQGVPEAFLMPERMLIMKPTEFQVEDTKITVEGALNARAYWWGDGEHACIIKKDASNLDKVPFCDGTYDNPGKAFTKVTTELTNCVASQVSCYCPTDFNAQPNVTLLFQRQEDTTVIEYGGLTKSIAKPLYISTTQILGGPIPVQRLTVHTNNVFSSKKYSFSSVGVDRSEVNPLSDSMNFEVRSDRIILMTRDLKENELSKLCEVNE